MKLSVALAGLMAMSGCLTAVADVLPPTTDQHKAVPAANHLRIDQITWVAAHNAYNNSTSDLLERGVRGLMWDLYPAAGGGDNYVQMCHSTTGWCNSSTSKSFAGEMNNVVLPFLRRNPDQIVTLILQNHVTRAAFSNALRNIPGIENLVFDPAAYGNSQWPTAQQLINSGRRLIIMSDVPSNALDITGHYTLNNRSFNVLRDSQWQVQNHFNLGNTIISHDWSCRSRWSSIPITTTRVGASGYTNWNRLFVMNQFHSFGSSQAHAGAVDNNLTHLEARVDRWCREANNGVRKQPNYIALDYLQTGDQFNYAAALTLGGVYFYEGNNATQDSVCVLENRNQTLLLPARGCENDEARSLRLRNLPAGKRITLWDSRDGNTQDDMTTIITRRPITDLVIGSFEQTVSNADYSMVFSRNNGLDGKVSRIRIDDAPLDFSDATVDLYEGNHGSQNKVCSVPLTHWQEFKFPGSYGCDNDEARSAVIVKARRGAWFKLGGDPNSLSSCSQGCVDVWVRRDLHTPVTIGSFERSYSTDDVHVTRSGGTQQLDGKVSRMRVGLDP